MQNLFFLRKFIHLFIHTYTKYNNSTSGGTCRCNGGCGGDDDDATDASFYTHPLTQKKETIQIKY